MIERLKFVQRQRVTKGWDLLRGGFWHRTKNKGGSYRRAMKFSTWRVLVRMEILREKRLVKGRVKVY